MFVLLAVLFGLMTSGMHGANFWMHPDASETSECASDSDVRLKTRDIRVCAWGLARPALPFGTLTDPRVSEMVRSSVWGSCMTPPTNMPAMKQVRPRPAPSRVGQVVLLI